MAEDPRAEACFRSIVGVEDVVRDESRFTIRGNGEDLVTNVIECLSDSHIRVTDFRTILPTLEDVFLKVTGRSIRD
jgi:ABC-2 type transport system ATP-binding protein